jgi:hypothetical protein
MTAWSFPACRSNKAVNVRPSGAGESFAFVSHLIQDRPLPHLFSEIPGKKSNPGEVEQVYE